MALLHPSITSMMSPSGYLSKLQMEEFSTLLDRQQTTDESDQETALMPNSQLERFVKISQHLCVTLQWRLMLACPLDNSSNRRHTVKAFPSQSQKHRVPSRGNVLRVFLLTLYLCTNTELREEILSGTI